MRPRQRLPRIVGVIYLFNDFGQESRPWSGRSRFPEPQQGQVRSWKASALERLTAAS